MTHLELENWVDSEKPMVIAGPCSAETEEQVMTIARQLAQKNINTFRAGIWKPRTRPNSFEGVGSEGLKWLQQVKKETGMKITTEVANVKHVYEALKAGVDILWIGARTSVNPFAIQEIADALQGVDIPVLVKNPINPDLSLWIGALERFNKVGIKKLGAIHRGFSSYGASICRNKPKWQIPIELKGLFPDLPIINDPSHIAGRRDMLLEIAQKAVDLDFDGLMIETHHDPDNAWSDAKQQITPNQLSILLADIVMRQPQEDNESFQFTLNSLREEIDQIDKEIIQLIRNRMHVAEEIGRVKRDNKVTILQNTRWHTVVEKAKKIGGEYNLSSDFMESYLKAIHQESINKQEAIMNEFKKIQ